MPATFTPALPIDPTGVCPRCAGTRIVCLLTAPGSFFDWYACAQCDNLWVLPTSGPHWPRYQRLRAKVPAAVLSAP